MGLAEKADVRKLLHDSRLMTEIAKAVVEDAETLDSVADDIADKLSDELEDDPTWRQRIVQAAMASPDFKKKIIRKLVEELD